MTDERRFGGGDESRVQALMAQLKLQREELARYDGIADENERLREERHAWQTEREQWANDLLRLREELEAENQRLRDAARAVIETSDAPTMTAEHEAILQLQAALDA